MEYLAHRGLWFEKSEKNTFNALCKALDEGFGLETDIRDLNGQLVISHDMPYGTPLLLDQLLSYYKEHNYTATLAINIKADGLQGKLQLALQTYNIKNYFVFDMSIPDTLGYIKKNIPVYIRCSELEEHAELTLLTQGIWLDELTKPWINAKIIQEKATLTSKLCIVSSELHGREHVNQWLEITNALREGTISNNLLLCTDVPHEASRYFK